MASSPDRGTREDLCQYVRHKLRELGLSYRDMSLRATDPQTGKRLPFQWINKLARGHTAKAPEAWQLRALAAGLGVTEDMLQALAARQWLGYEGALAAIAPADLALYLQWRDLPDQDKKILRILVEEFAHRREQSAVGVSGAQRAGAGRHATGRHAVNSHTEHAGPAGLLALARQADLLGWWHDYRDVVPGWFEVYLSLEPAASLIRTYETRFIPGLLQTEAYANAVIKLHHGGADPAQIRRRVELRMRRQQILHRPHPPRVWAVINEAVLHRMPGTAAAKRAQLNHLIKVCDRPNITIQVAPLNVANQAAAGGPITLLRFPEDELPDLIYLEQTAGALYPSAPADIFHYHLALSSVAMEAPVRAQTAAILQRILTQT